MSADSPLAAEPRPSAKTKAERAVTEPLEVWGNVRDENAPPHSTEHLEKMALDFDKINNPLCMASANGDTNELDYLLRDGASPDSTDSLGISALSHAILGNKKESLTRLLSAGANINQKGPFGVTPLMLAANSNLTEMVSFMLLNGADRNVTNDDGETALSIAKRKNLHDVVVLLEPAAKKTAKAPALNPAPEIPPAEPDATADITQPSTQEPTDSPLTRVPELPGTPRIEEKLAPQDIQLFNAVQAGESLLIPELISSGANPNVKTDEQLSPLIIAVNRGDLNSVESLLQNHAQIDILAEFDMTPLMLAAQNDNLNMIKLLLRRGADPRKENIAGQSACDIGLASTEPAVRSLFTRCLE